MHKMCYSNGLVLTLAVAIGLANSGCRSTFRNASSCGWAEETCDSPSCGIPSCGSADLDCDSPSCGIPSCGSADLDCDSVGCGSEIDCNQGSWGWMHKILGCFKLYDCAGELYWSEWHNDPPGAEPCDSCGNWTGPQGLYRAPYRMLPGPSIEPAFAQEAELNASTLAPAEDFMQAGLQGENPTPAQFNTGVIWPADEQTDANGPSVKDSFELALERETMFR